MRHVIAQIPPPPGNAIELGPLTIHYYGIAIAIGVLCAVTLIRRRYAAMGGDPDLADRVALYAVGAGLVGARLGYVLPRLDRFADDPLSMLAIWEGGLVFFGGLFAGAAAAIWLIRRWGGDLVAFADAVAPGIPLAQAFGRWGNYFNQELYGTPTDLPWALEIERGGQVVETVHPTFLYEMLGNLVLIGVLLALGRRGSLRRGSLMFAYAVGYGVLRFLMELIRTDERAFRFILTANGWVSVGITVVGLAGLWWWNRRAVPPDEPAPGGGVGAGAEATAPTDAAGDEAVPGAEGAVPTGAEVPGAEAGAPRAEAGDPARAEDGVGGSSPAADRRGE